MSIVLEDLLFAEGTKNMGGMAGFIFAALASDVLDITYDTDGVTVTAITMKSGKKFQKIYMTKDTGELKDTEVGERDGGSFETSLEWFTPDINGALLRMKTMFNNGGFIFIVMDANKVERVVGNLDYPAYREPGEIGTGKDPKGRRGGTFKFKAAANTPAPIFTGSVPLTIGA